MPVPTDTLRSIRKLNLVFAGSAVLLLLATVWLIVVDYDREWRGYQRDAQVWQAILTEDALANKYPDDLRQQLRDLDDQIQHLRNSLPQVELTQARNDLAQKLKEKQKRDLPLAIAKSEIVPHEQKIERARLTYGDESDEVKALRKEFAAILQAYQDRKVEVEDLEAEIERIQTDIAGFEKLIEDTQKQLDNLAREKNTLEEKLATLKPSGLTAVGQQLRNAPLLDAFNPSEKIITDDLPGVRTDLNFLTVETTDACRTCHFNIDKPEFQLENLGQFLQRQLGAQEGHLVNRIDQAVVWIGFWENAAKKVAAERPAFATDYRDAQLAALRRVRQAQADAVRAATDAWKNEQRPLPDGDPRKAELARKIDRAAQAYAQADKKARELADARPATWTGEQWAAMADDLHAELDRAARTAGDDYNSAANAYQQRQFYVQDIRELLAGAVGQPAMLRLDKLFVDQLIGRFNELRGELGLKQVSRNPVIFAHPKLETYVDPESPHAVKTMGCSVCHEGSGHETDFFHVAHVPQHQWVDRDSGAPVPDFLLTGRQDTESNLRLYIRQLGRDKASIASSGGGAVMASTVEPGHGHHEVHGASNGQAEISQADVNLVDPHDPAPFAPEAHDHAEAALYIDPSDPDTPRIAIRQEKHWEKKYHWHHVHYMEWEKPMHAMEYIESSCAKCHTQHYDLIDEAPRFSQGRELFTQIGCANCHSVESIADHLDVRRVGPDLAFVKEKLSPEMTSTWIWAPKAFRPASNMPHFFMLENNSTPMDILRTRVEVAAMTYYLHNAPPGTLEKLAQLQREMTELAGVAKDEKLPRSRRIEASNEYQSRSDAFEALKQQVRTYDPELPPAQAQLAALAEEAEALKAQLESQDAADEAKAKANERLAAIEQERRQLEENPMTGDPIRGRKLFIGDGNLDKPQRKPGWEAGLGCVACHTNMNETGREWIVGDLKSQFPVTGLIGLDKDLAEAKGKLTAQQAANVAARFLTAVPDDLRVVHDTKTKDAIIKTVGEAIAADLTRPDGDDLKNAGIDITPVVEAQAEAQRTVAAEQAATQLIDRWRGKLAGAVHDALSYNQQHTYALENLPHLLNRRGPELSGVGTKLLAGRSKQQAVRWLYDWLRNPKHYSSTTIMPSFRLTPQEALDLAEYLLQQQRPGAEDDADGTWRAQDFLTHLLPPQKQDGQAGDAAPADNLSPDEQRQRQLQVEMLDALAVQQGLASTARTEAKLYQLGKKMLTHYNCLACHNINGLEDMASTAPKLDGWGLKDPHMLDFGYYEHAEYRRREHPTDAWKVEHEGLTADAKSIRHDSAKLHERTLAWEHIEGQRRPWLYHKLHNTRVYDRGRYVLPPGVAALTEEVLGDKDARLEAMRRAASKAYDKLKMPKFFLRDDQVQAIITYVTSVRKPLVTPDIQVTDDVVNRTARGRQIATRYNCYGCHNIEGNTVAIQRYFGVTDEYGRFNHGSVSYETMVNGPPRLIGQGAKTKPDWTKWFLQNVHELRFWLNVRMPSFPMPESHAGELSEYFAGATQKMARDLEKNLAPIVGEDGVVKAQDKERRGLMHEQAQIVERLTADDAERQKPPQEQDQSKLMSDAGRNFSRRRLQQIAAQLRQSDNWLGNESVRQELAWLRDFAIGSELAPPRLIDPRTTTRRDRATLWKGVEGDATRPGLIRQLQFMQKTFDIVHPYPDIQLPDISEERFRRGENLFLNQMNCNKCHPMGNEQKLLAIFKKESAGAPPAGEADPYGDDEPSGADAPPDQPAPRDAAAPDASAAPGDEADPYGDDPYGADAPAPAKTRPDWTAPNLKYAVHRIQPRWMQYWIAHPPTLQPGTKMPPLWPRALDDFDASFVDVPDLPPEARVPFNEKFGWSGVEQRQLVIDYLIAAGMRNYTPRLWVIDETVEAPEYDKLPPVPKPKLAFEIPDIPDMTGTADTGPATTVTVGPIVEKSTSDIVLHEGDAPYEGDAVQNNKTRVVGVVKFAGGQQPRPIITMGDQNCAKLNRTPARSDALVVNDKGEMRYVLVRVKSAVPGNFDAPTDPVLLDQVGCAYKPHVISAMVGQPVWIRNSDPLLHNVHALPKVNDEFNVGQSVKGMVERRSFPRPELKLFVKCDVHGWMGAYIHVLENPFHYVSDVEGRFEIRGLPPGTHTLEAIHEDPNIAPVEFTVEVKADTSTRADVALSR